MDMPDFVKFCGLLHVVLPKLQTEFENLGRNNRPFGQSLQLTDEVFRSRCQIPDAGLSLECFWILLKAASMQPVPAPVSLGKGANTDTASFWSIRLVESFNVDLQFESVKFSVDRVFFSCN